MTWSGNWPTFEDWTQILGSCERSAWHLEMRDSYAVSNEDLMFTAWRDGHHDEPGDRDSWWRPWLSLMTETTERGVEVRRARIVSEPVTEYIRFEYDISFSNIAAGEQVRWLPRRQASSLALPGNDFWLLDGERVLFNHFTGDGDETDCEWSADPAVAKLCATAFESVWELATPHDAYRPG
ncbi:DUF6879 family protein [Actinomadura sp. DC4]|uniref:DUF6879 family protein n=1 Tax=Actinomadura sp. DC4 TaxID=3055069 RepID=UPI0025B20CA9|nr:DUF6879 family protein [Actinomadura sp. DC4]MDN3352946.1 hypothetical protein [Actinomadura sp. DC4]